MSTTDDSLLPVTQLIFINLRLKERWWHIMDSWKVGLFLYCCLFFAGR